MAQNKIYLGSEALVDLTGLATTGYVDSAVANVDVTDQLQNYVEKDGTKVLSTNDFTDAYKTKLDNIDPATVNSSINNLESTLGDITGDGAAVTAALDTWAEIKAFVDDYTSADSLATLLNSHDASVKGYVDGNFIPNTSYAGLAKTTDLNDYVRTVDLPSDHVQSTAVTNIVKLTAEAYAALASKDPSTLYIVG